MSYLAIYRRFRPTDFNNVVGQEHVVTTLINQIKTDRIGHAYLFSGARGTGKTTVARIFARAINCTNPQNGSPCGECEVCKNLLNPQSLDIIEIDAASNNKVDNVQDIRTNVQYPPVAGRFKVYIIDEVHMLTTEAFNALLKTLEEPPKHAVFILATTEPQKLPATILSRCMRFDFHLVSDKVIQNLIEKIYTEVGKEFEVEATSALAKAGEGSIRDALSLADLCLSYSNEKLTYKSVIDILGASDSNLTADLIQDILSSNIGNMLAKIDKLTNLGKSVSVLTKDVLNMLRDVLVCKTCNNAKEILMLPESEFIRLKGLAELADNHRLLRTLEIFTNIESDLRYSTHPRIVFESAATKAALPKEDYSIDALISRINTLEKKLDDLTKNGISLTTTTNSMVNQTPTANSHEQVSEKEMEPTKVEKTVEGVEKVVSEPEPKTDNNIATNSQTNNDISSQSVARAEMVESEKSAYKPVIEQNQEIKAEKQEVKEQKRLSGFDYQSDIPLPEEPPELPPENQIGFDTFELSYGKVVLNDSATNSPIQETEKVEKPQESVIRDRVPDARLWGTVIRKLRADKHIMLWIACQECDAKVEDNKLVITCEGENEYNLLIKEDNVNTISQIVGTFAPYKVKIVRVGQEETEDDKFNEDVKKTNKLFDNKLQINK